MSFSFLLIQAGFFQQQIGERFKILTTIYMRISSANFKKRRSQPITKGACQEQSNSMKEVQQPKK